MDVLHHCTPLIVVAPQNERNSRPKDIFSMKLSPGQGRMEKQNNCYLMRRIKENKVREERKGHKLHNVLWMGRREKKTSERELLYSNTNKIFLHILKFLRKDFLFLSEIRVSFPFMEE